MSLSLPLPLPRARAPSMAALAHLESALSALRLSHRPFHPAARRHASHQAQGRANKAKDGAGKRLGAKKTGGEYVIPGNILFKQRGTHWFPGDNCFMGRDHTIHAGAPGYVRYYRDPHRHPKRKYIGIVFDKDQALPQPPHAARRRHLGMLAYRMPDAKAERQHTDDLALLSTAPPTIRERPNTARQAAAPEITLSPTRKNPQGLKLTLRPGGQYRQANHEIGRAGDAKEAAAQAKGRTARLLAPYRPGDRFAAWRKSAVRMARNAERRTMGRGGKKK